MKVKIGKYIRWVGPYQAVDWLQYLGVSEDRCYKMGGKLANTWVGTFLQWVHEKRERKVKVHIDHWDVWSMDHTISMIVHPLLVRYKEIATGTFFIDPLDCPIVMSPEDGFDATNFAWDENNDKRWAWVIDEMIWAFGEQAIDIHGGLELSNEEEIKYNERKKRAFVFFGKYFQHLWD